MIERRRYPPVFFERAFWFCPKIERCVEFLQFLQTQTDTLIKSCTLVAAGPTSSLPSASAQTRRRLATPGIHSHQCLSEHFIRTSWKCSYDSECSRSVVPFPSKPAQEISGRPLPGCAPRSAIFTLYIKCELTTTCCRIFADILRLVWTSIPRPR